MYSDQSTSNGQRNAASKFQINGTGVVMGGDPVTLFTELTFDVTFSGREDTAGTISDPLLVSDILNCIKTIKSLHSLL